MSKILSLKLQNPVFVESERIITKLNIPRNTYINEALQFYNALNRRQLLKKQFAKESRLVANDSLAMLELFEDLDDGDGA